MKAKRKRRKYGKKRRTSLKKNCFPTKTSQQRSAANDNGKSSDLLCLRLTLNPHACRPLTHPPSSTSENGHRRAFKELPNRLKDIGFQL